MNGSFILGLIIMTAGLALIVSYNFFRFHTEVHGRLSRVLPVAADMLPENLYLTKASLYVTGKQSRTEVRKGNRLAVLTYLVSGIIFTVGYLIFVGSGISKESLNPVQRFFIGLDDLEEILFFFLVFYLTSRLSQPITHFLELTWLEKREIDNARRQLSARIDPVELDQFVRDVRQLFAYEREKLKENWFNLKPHWLRED